MDNVAFDVRRRQRIAGGGLRKNDTSNPRIHQTELPAQSLYAKAQLSVQA